jgi:hypothetical protein
MAGVAFKSGEARKVGEHRALRCISAFVAAAGSIAFAETLYKEMAAPYKAALLATEAAVTLLASVVAIDPQFIGSPDNVRFDIPGPILRDKLSVGFTDFMEQLAYDHEGRFTQT